MADITSTTGTSIPPKSVEPTVDPTPVTNPKPVTNPIPVIRTQPVITPPPGYPDLRPVQPVYRVPPLSKVAPATITPATPGVTTIPVSQVVLVTQTPPEPKVKPYIQSRPSFNPYKATAEAQAQESAQKVQASSQNPATEPVTKEPPRVPQNKFPTDLVYNEQEKRKNNNGWNPVRFINRIFSAIWQFFNLIKNIIITAFILFFLAVIAIFLIVEYKPPVFWNQMKTFLNDGLDFSAVPKIASADIYARINSTALNNQPVAIDNNELTQLVRDYNLLGDMTIAESIPNGMRFYINIDTPERPLWLIVETQINQYNKFAISKVGFGRFSAPSQLTGLFNDTLGQAFQFLESQVTSDSATSAVKLFLDTGKINKDLTLNRVEFEEGSVVLSYQHNSTGSSDLTY